VAVVIFVLAAVALESMLDALLALATTLFVSAGVAAALSTGAGVFTTFKATCALMGG
jgi:hypothetical protein